MTRWEYRKIYLNDLPPRSDEIDILNEAGADGWEIIGITGNNVAYLKRQLSEPEAAEASSTLARSTRRKAPLPPSNKREFTTAQPRATARRHHPKSVTHTVPKTRELPSQNS